MNTNVVRLLALEIRLEHDVVLCRQRARQFAVAFGFDTQEQTHIATAVSEIARNAFDYAGGGKIEFAMETAAPPGQPAQRRGAPEQSFVVTVRDQGPGIPPPGENRPPGGLGLGLSGAQRLMDSVDVATRPGATTVTMRKALPSKQPRFTTPQLQAVVDRIAAEPAANPLAELQFQNQELIRVIEQVHLRQDDLARVNQELADTNAGVLALYDELETLHRVGTLLASQLNLKTLLQAIIDATTDLTGAHFGAFFSQDESAGAWRIHAVSGTARAALSDFPPSEEADFFGVEFTNGATAEVLPGPSCRESKFARALGTKFDLQSCLAIPVASGTETMGAMVFGSEEPRAFTERSERIVSSIAAQAVVGIEKARLFEKVQSSSAAKDRFLAMLSHELRTPLNPVLAVVSSLVSDPRLPSDAQQDLNVVLRNVRLEARLIDDLLDFSRIINGKLQLQREPLDLHALIGGVVNICAEEISGGSHHIALELDAPQAEVFGDSARLQQVLWNVLKNAIKFTAAPGRITIRTASVEGMVEVVIADNGAGIEAGTLARIFSAFEQGDEHATPQFGGLGLGLAITKNFVELHGGTIRAASAGASHGTQIIMRFPLLKSEAAAPVIPSAVPAVAPEQPAGTLLLVDDHADTLNIMSRLLTRRGYRVVTAESCQIALETARENEFDLIVSDLGLPDGSGLGLLPRLREIRNVPAIALSGYGMEEDVSHSRAAGYNEHLTKPIDFPLLLRTIGKLLSRRVPV